MALAMVVPESEELGLEVDLKCAAQSILVSCGDHLLPSQITELPSYKQGFSDMFLPLFGHSNVIEHHIEVPEGLWYAAAPTICPNTKNK